MVKSKFKPFGIFALIVSVPLLLGICFILYALVSVIFFGGHIFPRGTLSQGGALIFILFFTGLSFSLVLSFVKYPFIININKAEQTISFKNVFTQKRSSYLFSDFDCYIDTLVTSLKKEDYKVIYLVKNRKAEKIITGFYYSNMEELQEALSLIKYKGFEKRYTRLYRRTLLGKAIID